MYCTLSPNKGKTNKILWKFMKHKNSIIIIIINNDVIMLKCWEKWRSMEVALMWKFETKTDYQPTFSSQHLLPSAAAENSFQILFQSTTFWEQLDLISNPACNVNMFWRRAYFALAAMQPDCQIINLRDFCFSNFLPNCLWPKDTCSIICQINLTLWILTLSFSFTFYDK